MRKLITLTAVLSLVVTINSARAANISLDFNNTTDPPWVVDGNAGPHGSGNWNSTSSASGGPSALVNSSGGATGATVTWTSSNTWTNADGNSTQDRRLSHAYLDDGQGGVLVTVNNIPYTKYRVYGLLATDQNGQSLVPYTSQDFDVNGTWVYGGGSPVTAQAYGTITANANFNGQDWTRIDANTIGNYWTTFGTSPTLTIDGQNRNGTAHGSLTAIIIEAVVPEPSTGALLLVGLVGTAVCRRRRR